jgi:exodeoxyribonuclease V alpha subunit
MTENPYRLTRDVRGIGFKTTDAIAMKLGIEKTHDPVAGWRLLRP